MKEKILEILERNDILDNQSLGWENAAEELAQIICDVVVKFMWQFGVQHIKDLANTIFEEGSEYEFTHEQIEKALNKLK